MSEEKETISVDELYNIITSQITPEVALRRMLEGGTITYEKLKFQEDDVPLHPIVLATYIAMDMGWNLVLEKNEDENAMVQGLVIGTREFLDKMLKGELIKKDTDE